MPLVKEGVITSRSDVLQSLTDAGFEIARQTDKAISIKNPDPESKRNIRLTGGLYERDFNFSREVQNTVETASNEYRAGATERYNAAKQLYDSEIERKRDYHQGRHGQPTAKQQAVTDNVVRTENRYRYSPYDIFRAAPTPFVQRFTTARRRHADDDRRLRNRYNDVDTATRGQASQNYQVRDESMGNLGFLDYIRSLDTRHHARSVNSKQSQGADLHLQAVERPSAAISPTVPTAEVRVNYGQEIARTSTESTTGAGRHDTATAADARRQRPRYSRIDSIIDQASTSSNTASRALAELIRTITEQDKRTDDRTKQLDESSQELLREHEGLSSRVNDVMQRSNSASREHERVSECSSATREFKREYRAVEGKIEQFAENAERTRDLTNKNNQLADRNTDGVDGIKQIADQAREVIKTQENQRQQRYSAPRMGM